MMTPIFKEKIMQCRSIAEEIVRENFQIEVHFDQEVLLHHYLDETKINGIITFLDLYNAFGFTTENLLILKKTTLDASRIYKSTYTLMDKWVETLFLGKKKFETYFNIEIQAHNNLRENAAKKGIRSLNLSINFANIANYIDRECGTVSLAKCIERENQKAIILKKYEDVIDEHLVVSLATISIENFHAAKNKVLEHWLYKANGFPDQLIYEQLKALHFFINSIDVAVATGKNFPLIVHFRILRINLITKMHQVIQVTEWLFEGKTDNLDTELYDLLLFCNEKYK